jgi:hypothetical protein
MSNCPCLHISGIWKTELMEKGISFCFCKWKMETANCYLSSAQWKRMFVLLGRQTINGNRQVLFQQTCPSLEVRNAYNPGRLGGGLATWNSSILAWVWTRWAFVSLQTKIPKPFEFHKMILFIIIYYRKQIKLPVCLCFQVKNKPQKRCTLCL